MNAKFTVRVASQADGARMHALRTTVFRETDFLLWEPTEFNDTPDDKAKRIDRLNAQPNSRCLVAEAGGQLVGFVCATGQQVNRQRRSTTLALAVRKSHWGRGIASELLSEILAWSKAAGLARVDLTVNTANHRAIALYLRHGFFFEGTRRKSLQVAGRLVDEYVMATLNES